MPINTENLCLRRDLPFNPLDPIIDNGSFVQMGINSTAQLNVPGGRPSSETGTPDVGLRYIPTNGESTSPGCLCEGWGVANFDAGTGLFSMWANVDQGGAFNMTVEPGTGVTNPTGQILPESTGSAFISIVQHTGGRVRVVHDYHPSPSPNLYQVDVSIDNISALPIGDLRYRRVMDWDAEPTAFNEWVRIHVGTAVNLVRATTDGFDTANPLVVNNPTVGVPPTTLVPGSPDYFSGPEDQGALFDFSFGELNPGESRAFNIFYGAAETEAQAQAAIASVGAEVYSFGYPTNFETGEALTNGPNVYIFAFRGVGGPAVGADLAITKTDSSDPVTIGENLVYHLTVTNNGPFEATTVTVTDDLPPGVSIVSANPSQGVCFIAAGAVTCDLGTLGDGESATVDIEVIPFSPGIIVNHATVTSDQPDPDPSNNFASESTNVLAGLQPECIQVSKLYDWVVFANRVRNKVAIPDDCQALVDAAIQGGMEVTFSCLEPAFLSSATACIPCKSIALSPDLTCRIASIRRETITVSGSTFRVGIARFIFGVDVQLRVFADDTLLCEFPVTVYFEDDVVLCLPEPLDESNITCQISAVECSLTGSVLLGGMVEVDISICKEIQVIARVTMEVLGEFCTPRPNSIPVPSPTIRPDFSCPPMLFPPQCPIFFPSS